MKSILYPVNPYTTKRLRIKAPRTMASHVFYSGPEHNEKLSFWTHVRTNSGMYHVRQWLLQP